MNRNLALSANRSLAGVLGAALPLLLAAPASAQSLPVYQPIVNFENFAGKNPTTPVIQGPDGSLYGACAFGGNLTWGCIFVVHPDGSLVDLFDFDSSTTGGVPYGGLMQAADGWLYGTTNSGGSYGFGTIYKINTDGTGFTVLANLDGTNTGRNPACPLTQGRDGSLYGTTWSGGYYGYGTAFKIDTDGSNLEVINSFDYTTNGGYLAAGLLQASDNAFYGVTTEGGSFYNGAAFKLSLKTSGGKTFWACDVIGNFDPSSTGGIPYSTLMEASDGLLYGMASQNGALGSGTVFALSRDGSTFVSVHDFDVTTGDSESSVFPLIEGADGSLYGTAYGGGNLPILGGTAFKMDKDGSNFVVFYLFDPSVSGWGPLGLSQGYDGNLYGTTYSGFTFTAYERGAVFRFVLYSASWSNYGSGLAGTNGIPTFVSSAPPILGSTITLTIENSLGQGTGGLLLAGTSQASIPYKGGTILVGQFLLVQPLFLASPDTNLSFTIPTDPSLSDFKLYLQTLELDPGAVKGVSLTPGLELVLGL